MQIHHYFPGSNTPSGFVNRFHSILPASRRRRVIVLKGGPGVGKSTFMRRIGAHFEPRAGVTEYFHCSSDPHSLDAVSFPEAGVYLVDGTAPHIVDPSLPGAADGILNLGEYLDEPALETLRPQLEALQHGIGAQFDRAYCCLRACAALREDTAATYAGFVNAQRLHRLCRRLCGQYLPAAASDAPALPPRELFLTAYTPDGLISLLSDNLPARVIRLLAPWGADVSPVLRAVLDCAVQSGVETVSFLDPLFPDRPAHVYLPGEGLLFTTLEVKNPEAQVDLAELYDPIALRREDELIVRRRVTFDMNERSACDALSEAHRMHDELEIPYIAHMNFERWQERFDASVEKLDRYFS